MTRRRRYGTCQHCERRYTLRIGGAVRTHWQGDVTCPGSGLISMEQWGAALESSRRLLQDLKGNTSSKSGL